MRTDPEGAAPSFAEVEGRVDELRGRINALRRRLAELFVDKAELVDLMAVCALAQEPLLLVGKPGTAKSDLVLKFCQALGLRGAEYFEYMLTRFTEPSEIVGPIDIAELRGGRYLRRMEGKLPEAQVAFLDEIFKSNSAILNTLLTILNERKVYQDGQPVPIPLVVLFAATNEIPEHAELGALRDRFIIKAESASVRHARFDELIDVGLRNEGYRARGQRPWESLASLRDLLGLKRYIDEVMFSDPEALGRDRERFFPAGVYALFRRILETLEAEDGVELSDRKVIKLYKLIRTRAFLFHGGVVGREDLVLLRYVADRVADFRPVREKVDALLKL